MKAIPLDTWLAVMDRQYLSADGFVRNGGSAVKFVISSHNNLRQALVDSLSELGRQHDFVPILFRADERRLDRPPDLFYTMAEHLDWRTMARRLILDLAREQHLQVDGITPDGQANIYVSLAKANKTDPFTLPGDILPALEQRTLHDPRMLRDFGWAVRHLCMCEARADEQFYGGSALLDWLKGQERRLASVRHFHVHTSVNTLTARRYMGSLCRFVRQSGQAGTILILDIRRLTRAVRPGDDSEYYTKNKVLACYEVLRDLVDNIDSLGHTLVVVVARPEFTDGSITSQERGHHIYPALSSRIENEVAGDDWICPENTLIHLEQGVEA